MSIDSLWGTFPGVSFVLEKLAVRVEGHAAPWLGSSAARRAASVCVGRSWFLTGALLHTRFRPLMPMLVSVLRHDVINCSLIESLKSLRCRGSGMKKDEVQPPSVVLSHLLSLERRFQGSTKLPAGGSNALISCLLTANKSRSRQTWTMGPSPLSARKTTDGSLRRGFLIFPLQPVVFSGCILCPNPRCLWKKLRNVSDSWSIELGFSFTS